MPIPPVSVVHVEPDHYNVSPTNDIFQVLGELGKRKPSIFFIITNLNFARRTDFKVIVANAISNPAYLAVIVIFILGNPPASWRSRMSCNAGSSKVSSHWTNVLWEYPFGKFRKLIAWVTSRSKISL